MNNGRWRNIGLSAVALGAAAGIWAALRYGNRYLDQFENAAHDENVCGEFFTTAAGWRIHFIAQGEGSPVVLIHGFMDSLQTWRRNVQALAETHRVYAFDVLGFGSSDRVRAPIYTLKQQARFLREFFVAQSIEHADIIGHSMGGALALQFAYDFPDLVHKLVVIAPATYLYAAFPRNGLRPIPRRVSRGILGLYERWQGERASSLRLAYGDPEHIPQDALPIRNQMRRVRGTHDALISMSKSKRESDVPHQLKHVDAPTLIVWGKRDHVVPIWHAQRHSRELPNARLEWIETAGHLPHEEEPDSVNELLIEFLDRDQ